MKHFLRKSVLFLALFVSGAGLVGSYLFSLYRSDKSSERTIIPSQTHVEISREGSDGFLKPSDVLAALPFRHKDTIPIPINTAQLESLLLARSPIISDVQAYISPSKRQLNLRITERFPLLRYYTSGQSHIVDREGVLLSSSHPLGLPLPLVTGEVPSKEIQKELFELALFLEEHPKWADFFGSIHVLSPTRFHFYPRIGDVTFEVDGLDGLEENLDKIETYYKKIFPKVGNKYSIVKLSYKNQIVGKHAHSSSSHN